MVYVDDPKRVLVFTGDRNKSGKSDYTGAFDPYCKAFMKLHNVPEENRCRVDLSLDDVNRKKMVLKFIHDRTETLGIAPRVIAVFSHGLPYKIQIGFFKYDCAEWAARLRDACGSEQKDITIILYCCSTGDGVGKDGDKSFADKLRDELCVKGFVNCRVVAHTCAGDAVQNSWVRFFDGMGSSAGGIGGIYVVAPKTTLWKKWVKALKDKASTLKFRFPLMSIGEVHDELMK